MFVVTSLVCFATFWVSLVYAEGAAQLAYCIVALLGIFLNGIWGVHRGDAP